MIKENIISPKRIKKLTKKGEIKNSHQKNQSQLIQKIL